MCERLEARVFLSASTSTGASTDALPPLVPGEFHFFTDPSLSTPGLVGSYIDQNLQGDAGQADWRATQQIAGMRVDPTLNFINNNWGKRADVGLTHGSDQVWQQFSVQWDGYVQIVSAHLGLTVGSDNGSRLWIDINHDGNFDSVPPEYVNDGWGTVPNFVQKASSPLLPAGVYKVRIQFAVDDTGTVFEVIPNAPPMVRVAYVIPSNRTAQSGAVEALQQSIEWMHSFYGDQMDRYGFGPRNFDYETEADGVTPQIWVVHVNDTDAHVRQDLFNNTINDFANATGIQGFTNGQDWLLIPEAHVESSSGAITGSTSLGASLGSGLDGGDAVTGSDFLPFLTNSALTDDRPYGGMIIPEIGKFPLVEGVSQPSFNGSTVSSLSSVFHGALIHELTHGFGLPHDMINDANFHGNLMYNGFRGFRGWAYPFRYSSDDITLGYGEALALSTSDYFNPDRPINTSSIPGVRNVSSGSLTPVNGLLPIHFTASDRLGLSSVLLLRNGNLTSSMALSGTNFDGTIDTPYYTDNTRDTFGLLVYDQFGNRTEVDVQITPKAGSPQAPQPAVTLSSSTVAVNQPITLTAAVPPFGNGTAEWDLGDGNWLKSTSSGTLQTHFTEPGTHLIRARIADFRGLQSISNPIAVRVLARGPRLSGIVVNDGSAQRSLVSQLTITFDQPTTLAPGALQLRGGAFVIEPIAINNPSGDGRVYVITFTGADVRNGSLPDGTYLLQINASDVTAAAPFAQPLSDGNQLFRFQRLFGDANGDGIVNSADYALFSKAFGRSSADPAFLSYFDFNGDGVINNADFFQFNKRFGIG